jgi:hypothetical protein
MEVICIEDEAFYQLIEIVVQKILEKENFSEEKWISPQEAMRRLRISSKTTLQKLRDEGEIRFSQPEKKHIVYDQSSIDEYFEKHSNKPIQRR